MRHIVICGLLYNIFPHYVINGKIFGGGELLNINCVFWSSLQICLEHFSFYEELNEIWSKMYIGLHVKYQLFLSDFNETWNSSTDFRKILKYHIKWKSVQWESWYSMGSNRRTDSHDEATKCYSQFSERACKLMETHINWIRKQNGINKRSVHPTPYVCLHVVASDADRAATDSSARWAGGGPNLQNTQIYCVHAGCISFFY